MNFDLDDPLGDLLSDNSSDSFFNESSSTKPKSTETTIINKSTTATQLNNNNNSNKSSKIQDLFRIKTNNTTTNESTTSTLQQQSNQSKLLLETTNKSNETQLKKSKDFSTTAAAASGTTPTPLSIAKTEPLSRSTPKKQISFDDDKNWNDGDNNNNKNNNNNILSDLGFDPKKPKSTNTLTINKKSSNILDDLLGINEKNTLPLKTSSSAASSSSAPSSSSAIIINSSQQFGNRPKTTTTPPPQSVSAGAQLSRQSTTEKSDQGTDLQFTPKSSSSLSSFTTTAVVRPVPAPPQTPTFSGRSRRNSSSINPVVDSLDLFSNDMKTGTTTTNQQILQKSTPETKRKTQLSNNQKKKPIIDWLGLGDDDPPVSSPAPPAPAQPIVSGTQQTNKLTNTAEQQPPQQNDQENYKFTDKFPIASIGQPISIPNTNDLILNVGGQQLAAANMETAAMMDTLNQQEIQLVMANQMKNQEMALIDMQRRQQQLLQKQETHFNDLLQKQLQRQGILEENIKRQQERLNSHIQILLTQPHASSGGLKQSYDSIGIENNHFDQSTINLENDEGGKHNSMDNRNNHQIVIELKSNCKRLELEKLRLEDLLQAIKNNHQNEIDLMEQSYRKQIGYLEEMLEKLQARLTDENAAQEEYFRKKINAIERDKENLLQEYEQKLEDVQKKHEGHIEKLKKYHTDEIEDINNGHKMMIDNIRQSKLMEFALVQENTSYLQTLKSAVTHLESSNVDLKTIQSDLQEKIDRIHRERDEQLTKREKRLADDQIQLDKQKNTTEQEKSHLLELVHTLELKLNAVTQSSSEEQWTIRQQRASIDAERKSFDREKEFFREQSVHEEQKLNELKLYQSTEYERRMKQLDDERMIILSERAKLETMARLAKTNDGQQMSKTEIDSAVKVAEDATRQADAERERLLDVQRQYECKKRELIDQESALRSKQSELEQALNVAHLKEKESENAIKQAKTMESKLMTRMQLLHRNYRELNERESRLSQDKLEMSKERLELQSIRKQLFQSRCSLCKIGERSQELSDLLLNEVKESKSKVVNANATTTTTTTTGSYPNIDPFNMDKQMPLKQSEILQMLDNIDSDSNLQFNTHQSKSSQLLQQINGSSLNFHQHQQQQQQQQQQYSITNALDKFNIIDNLFDDNPELLLASSSDYNKYYFNIDLDNYLPVQYN